MRNCAAFNLTFPILLVAGLAAAAIVPLMHKLKTQKQKLEPKVTANIPFDILLDFVWHETKIIDKEWRRPITFYDPEEMRHLIRKKKFYPPHRINTGIERQISNFSDTGIFFDWTGLNILSIFLDTDEIKIRGMKDTDRYILFVLDKRQIEGIKKLQVLDEKEEFIGSVEIVKEETKIRFLGGQPAW